MYEETMNMIIETLNNTEGIQAELLDVKKPNDASYKGISVSREDSNIAVTVPAENLCAAVLSGAKTVEDIVEDAIQALANGPEEIDVSHLGDYSWVKNHLTIQAMSAEKNEAFLQNVPHTHKEDLAFICRIDLGMGTAVVTNDILARYGIDQETLFADAIECAHRNRPMVVVDVAVVMAGMMGIDPEEAPGGLGNGMYVCSAGAATEAVFGAGVLAYPEFERHAREALGGNFYVLPSSIHEVLLLKETPDMRKEDLLGMVCEVNNSEVTPEDRLSDSVYYCDESGFHKVA